MTWLTEEVRRLYREATARRNRGALCPSAERLAALITSSSPRREREADLEHVGLCSDCAEELRLLADARAELAGLAPKRERQARDLVFGPSAARALAAAAVLVIAVGVVALRSRTPVQGPTGERGGRTVSGPIVPPDGARLDELPALLDWPDEPTALGYRATLYDFESTPLWEGRWSTDSSTVIPEDVRLSLRPGRIYYWRTFVRIGAEVRTSHVHRFELAP